MTVLERLLSSVKQPSTANLRTSESTMTGLPTVWLLVPPSLLAAELEPSALVPGGGPIEYRLDKPLIVMNS
jgi:hypothetical protein